MASRAVAALLGGYALANTLSIALVAALPLARADAVLVALQGSFLVYAAATLWAFAARSVRRVWLGLGVATLLSGLAAAWLT